MKNDTFWVIEMQGAAYLSVATYGGHVFEWSEDISKAISFCTEPTADQTMMAIRDLRPDLFPPCLTRPAKAVEHAWLDSAIPGGKQ